MIAKIEFTLSVSEESATFDFLDLDIDPENLTKEELDDALFGVSGFGNTLMVGQR
jgi:hypothetical protein